MDRSKGEVWVFAEQEEGKLSEVPFELLGKGRELADRLGVPLAAVLMGDKVEGLAQSLFEGGADKVHLVDDPALKVFRNKAYRHAFVKLVKECSPQIVIFGAIYLGIVALLPIVAGNLLTSIQNLAIGGTSVIIVVSVALETSKALEAQMLMRHYKGFLD